MNRFRLATLTTLLLAATGAHADIPVEDRPLTAPAPVMRPAPVATVAASTPAAATAAGTPATAATPPAGGGAWEQYTQIEQLQQQIQQLQGLIEQQGFQIEKLQNDLRVRYTDLDQRLSAHQDQITDLQHAAQSGGTGSAPGAGTAGAATPAGAASPPAAAGGNLEEEKRAYLAAYDTFRAGGPDKAIPPMLAFVKRYPNSTLVPSAYYWLGEFYLNASTPDQAAAQKQFDIVLANYPNSPKAAAALYKTGAILDLRGKPLEAKKRMQELLEKYPKSPEATLAQNYLDALETASKPAAKNQQSSAKGKAGKGGKAAPQTTSRKKN